MNDRCDLCQRKYGVQQDGRFVHPFDVGYICTGCQRDNSLEAIASRRNDQREANRIHGRY